MLAIAIPGFRDLKVEHLVFDYNGTLAIDGTLLPGVREALGALAAQVEIHVVTADTFGSRRQRAVRATRQDDRHPARGAGRSEASVRSGPWREHVCAIGNGRNDRKMLAAAAVGIALVQREAAAGEALAAAAVVALDVLDALDLLRHPARLIATLRS